MESPPKKYAPPWVFGLTNLPFGIAGGYVFVAMPFLMANAGVSGEKIATIASITLLPAFLQLFYAPIVDLGIRRREWLVLMSILGALCMGAATTIPFPPIQIPMASAEVPWQYKVLVVLGQAFCGLVASCNGALVSLTLPTHEKVKAAGWVNAANLGGAVFGGGVIMTLAEPSALVSLAKVHFVSGHPGLLNAVTWLTGHCSLQTAAWAIVIMVSVPSLVALTIPEPPASREAVGVHLKAMTKDVWNAVKARKGWTGLLFCISPVGTMALTNLFSDMGADFHTPSSVVVLLNGFGAGCIQAVAALGAGYLITRMDCRKAYLLSGILTAICVLVISVCPLTQSTFVSGCVAYMIVSGLAYTAFSAVVYEIVGTAGKTAATLYSVFPAIGNLAIMYTTYCDGRGQKWAGSVRGAFWGDCVMNVVGVAFLLWMLHFLKQIPETEGAVEPEIADALVVA